MLFKDDLASSLDLDTPVFVDSAYVWMLRDFDWADLINVSKKNWKVNKLSEDDIDFNTILWSIRVKVEHVIWHIKRFNIVSTKFRNRIHWNYSTVKINLKHLSLVLSTWLQNLHRILGE